MTGGVYLDTSVLAKVYLAERRADDVQSFLATADDVCISSLCILEMRSLLSRRRRMGDLARDLERMLFARVRADVDRGEFRVLAMDDAAILSGASIIHRLADIPLRTLDAAHLAIAETAAIQAFATADHVQAAAAEAIGLRVVRFD